MLLQFILQSLFSLWLWNHYEYIEARYWGQHFLISEVRVAQTEETFLSILS